jgi:hypothetical protein
MVFCPGCGGRVNVANEQGMSWCSHCGGHTRPVVKDTAAAGEA